MWAEQWIEVATTSATSANRPTEWIRARCLFINGRLAAYIAIR